MPQQTNNNREKVVISLGGSLVVPPSGIAITFLKKFNNFIRNQIVQNSNLQFFIVVGGGNTTRHYQKGAREVLEHELTPDDLDWLGIHATRLNAHLIRTIFRDIAHPYILKHYEIIRKVKESVVIGAGWKPGWSTDFCAAMVCEDYHAKTIVNLSNIEQVFDKDPNIHSNAKRIAKIKWEEFRKLVGNHWIPGMNAPFDPIASKKAQELGLKVVVVRGDNFKNLEHYFEGKKFVGTIIEG